MNNIYIDEYLHNFERVLSTGHLFSYSHSSIERMISYSSYFQCIEKDTFGYAPIINSASLIKEVFPDITVDLVGVPIYNQCLWAADAYLRIQEATGLTFECIFLYLPINKMYEYFPLYHEMDFSQIIAEFNRLFIADSCLSIAIKRYRISLQEVSKRTGISYNTLYSLKKRRRDINKLNVKDALKIASVLQIRIETLIEYCYLENE